MPLPMAIMPTDMGIKIKTTDDITLVMFLFGILIAWIWIKKLLELKGGNE